MTVQLTVEMLEEERVSEILEDAEYMHADRTKNAKTPNPAVDQSRIAQTAPLINGITRYSAVIFFS